jgi:hypothetical protein
MAEKLMGVASVVIAAATVIVVLLTVTGVTVACKYCKRKCKCCRKFDRSDKRGTEESAGNVGQNESMLPGQTEKQQAQLESGKVVEAA